MTMAGAHFRETLKAPGANARHLGDFPRKRCPRHQERSGSSRTARVGRLRGCGGDAYSVTRAAIPSNDPAAIHPGFQRDRRNFMKPRNGCDADRATGEARRLTCGRPGARPRTSRLQRAAMTGVLALSCGWAQARTPGAYDWMGALDKTARFLSTPAALNAGNCARVVR